MTGLTNQEVMKIVNRYIGVTGGYLGDFSYRTYTEFYPEYCDLDIDPFQYPGTTRERFVAVLINAQPDEQSKIIRGVLDRFPLDDKSKPLTRTKELFDQLVDIARRLEGAVIVAKLEPKITSEVVNRAIVDAETLIRTTGAISGVDRIHTVLHGYLIAVCDSENIQYGKDESMTKLFKLLRLHHPRLQDLGSRSQDLERVLQSLASIMDALNPIRNNASVAHPNSELISKDEAMLVINTTRTLLNYLDEKFK